MEIFLLKWNKEIYTNDENLDQKCCCLAINNFLIDECDNLNDNCFENYKYSLNRIKILPNSIIKHIYSFMPNIFFNEICTHCGFFDVKVYYFFHQKDIKNFIEYNDKKNIKL